MSGGSLFAGPSGGLRIARAVVLLVVGCFVSTGCGQPSSLGNSPARKMDEISGAGMILNESIAVTNTTSGPGVILNESISVSTRPARMVRVLSIPLSASEGKKEHVSPETGDSSRIDERSSEWEQPAEADVLPPVENLLDEMDVYALSPHAVRLALPRMVSREYVQLARKGAVHLPTPEAWQEIIHRASARYGLDPQLVAAVIRVESNFDTLAESPKGAQGLMQLMPETQAYLGVGDPFDAEANVAAGSDYLRQQLDRFGSLELALAAYNAGPGTVIRYGGIPPFPETQAYVDRVLAYYRAAPVR